MKIVFKKIKIKNFLSVGSVPIEYSYQRGINGITGENGLGKSMFINEALIFALYGKSMRGLTLEFIVNKINEQECEVTLWLDINEVPYRIERGLKPNYLRLINETEETNITAKKETQQKINDLIKVSMFSFINTISLNINFSKPFLRFEAAEKRTMFEDSMNLSIFGKMLKLSSKEYNEYKQQKKVLESELSSCKNILNERLETKEKLKTIEQEFENNKQKEIKKLETEYQEIFETHTDYIVQTGYFAKNLNEMKTKLIEIQNKIQNKIYEIELYIKNSNKDIQKIKDEIEFYKTNPICPLCKKPTNTSHDKTHVVSLEDEIKKKSNNIDNYKTKLSLGASKLNETKGKITKIEDQITRKLLVDQKLQETDNKLKIIENQIKTTKDKTIKIQNAVSDKDIEAAKNKVELKTNEYNENEKLLGYADYLRSILGEDGVRTYIVKKIVPLLNKKTNEYISLFGGNYSISFDNELKETLKSRRRDVVMYENFSSGEAKRIDFAFMFAFLDIAKLQNSIDSNILILDEMLDGSLNAAGIECLLDFLRNILIKKYPDLCVYIITHKSEIDKTYFDRVIKLKKENEFTKFDSIEEIRKSSI